ncbi:MAG: hypothetical protein HYX53_02855 [Chloroflexi bacterium]|nr:hypothetical protein [Chloroflexota bacterium]
MTAGEEGAWRKWFEEASAARAGGDLLFLVDEAPDAQSELDARLAAADSLLGSRVTGLANEQIERVLSKHPASARAYELRARLLTVQTPPPGAPLAAFIFSGHMVDAPTRQAPRFPVTSVSPVTRAISASLDEGGAREGCLAVSSAAAGGDLLFIEAALALRMKVAVCLPFDEQRFLASSVAFAGVEWTKRYQRSTRAPGVTLRVLPLAPPPGANPYERCNRWQLYSALASGASSVRGIVVWNGRTGDGPGGTGHMVDEMRRRGIPVEIIHPLDC